MIQFTQYYGRFEGLRGQVDGLPSWARTVLFIAALPGVALIALSILAFLVSLLALLLLTVPLYRLLQAITGAGGGRIEQPGGLSTTPFDDPGSAGRKRVEATVVEQ